MRLLVDSLLEENEPDPGKTREYLELVAGETSQQKRFLVRGINPKDLAERVEKAIRSSH